jgi:hypothetical protein
MEVLHRDREVLAEMSIELNARQMKRAADKDASGRRKLGLQALLPENLR